MVLHDGVLSGKRIYAPMSHLGSQTHTVAVSGVDLVFLWGCVFTGVALHCPIIMEDKALSSVEQYRAFNAHH